MSGGSWDYVSFKVADIVERLRTSKAPERRVLGERLVKLADALHAIEWVDSSDTSPGDEIQAIKACLETMTGHPAELVILAEQVRSARQAVNDAEEALRAYQIGS